MIDATAIIMTKNEEKNIVDCLQSMKGFAKRCVVIDCGSTDETVRLAKENGADVYFHEFEYYAKQFNWGIDHCDIDTEWIIRLDADERFPQELCAEIEEIVSKNRGKDVNGITIEADFFFLGRCMKHGPRNKRKKHEGSRQGAHTKPESTQMRRWRIRLGALPFSGTIKLNSLYMSSLCLSRLYSLTK